MSTLSRLRLPTPVASSPTCGSCYEETTSEDGAYFCDPCGLCYGDGWDEAEATYADPDRQPCGKACDNYWHTPEAESPSRFLWACVPCSLPEGHESDCWTSCTARSKHRGEGL